MPLTALDTLRTNLATHYQRLARIEISIGAQDGGPRMSIQFLDAMGATITTWEDWVFSLNDIEAELRRSWSVVDRSGFGYVCTFRVRSRHRTPTAPEPQP